MYGEDITKNTSYILHFIDRERFMVSLRSSLVINVSEEIHKIK